MSSLIDQNTRVLIQGITGKQGRRVSMEMLDYGTHVVAGVTPGKGGQEVYGVPVYDTVEEAAADASVHQHQSGLGSPRGDERGGHLGHRVG